ncbi:DUF3310 domain-containing protein [Peptostreptococcus equinus]|uniref:DUF3310 domain-containing protein n=1 Tax=Peptostreptococcus equinus TaxID=3003601 RepID=A0ABY7JTQ6_9FIRM|nr:DUF3310 domain-containing protein [Peptostreptococcus sp. CBA3647]WAW15438.1 DUF3310 domain-containing protein [Peptostreptococcus sp. CBA3647]
MLMIEEVNMDDRNSTRVNGQTPTRYAGKGKHNIETIEAMEYVCSKFDSKQAVSISQIVKYLSRYNDKDGYRDLDAAVDYIKRLTGEWK